MLPTFALSLALGALPQAVAASRIAAELTASPRLYTGATLGGGGALGTLALTVYPLRPVRDDDAPLDLQPFLQRVSSVDLAAHASFDQIDNVDRVRATDTGLGLRADFTLWEVLVVGASAGWATRAVEHLGAPGGAVTAPGDPITFAATLGARVGDVRVDATYAHVHRTPGDFSAYRQRVTLRARAVLGRRLDLTAELNAHAPGAGVTQRIGGAAAARWLVSRQVGVGVRAALSPQGVWTGSDRTDLALGFGAEASWWPWPRGRVSLAYDAVLERQPAETFLRHAWQLGLAWRFAG